MKLIEELLKQVPTLLGKTISEEAVELTLDQFAAASLIKLQSHYDTWRQRVRSAASSGVVMSNGWAFSMMSGLAFFEAHVRADDGVKQIYCNKSGEIERTVEQIQRRLHGKQLNGAMIYGYGNLLRESFFIEQALRGHLLSEKRIYLLDCSLFYHIFAKSPLNPLRGVVKRTRNIRPELLDYCESDRCLDRLSYIRDDLNSFFPVLHLFLGNTFCNVDAPTLQRILTATVRPGDVVVAEYANYPAAVLKSCAPDYVNTMAIRAAAELFATGEDTIVATTVLLDDSSRAVLVETPDCDRGDTVKFRTMLRRKYGQQELVNGEYELVWSCQVLSGALYMDSYQRMTRPR